MPSILPPHASYHVALGVAPGADLATITAAYHARLRQEPADKRSWDVDFFTEAYRVLKNEVLNADDDLPSEEDADDPMAAFCCSLCGQITAQPRYVIFRRVTSYLVWSGLQRVSGIFCRDCADVARLRSSVLTWLLGWWSVPGLLATPLVLLYNLFGGHKPRSRNAALLTGQARVFLAMGRPEVARPLAEQARAFAWRPSQRRAVLELLRACGPHRHRLKDRWKLRIDGVFLALLLPLVAWGALLWSVGLLLSQPWEKKPPHFSAMIEVRPSNIGDIRHVVVDDLKLRERASDTAPLSGLLDRFTSVQVVQVADQWSEVKTTKGVLGWVETKALYAGEGDGPRQEWCQTNRGELPEAGDALQRRVTGEHRLMIYNPSKLDAVVKLKTVRGATALAYFIPATYRVIVGGIPEGTYRIEFATGRDYSRACGLFMDNMQANVLPQTLTYRHVSLLRTVGAAGIPEVDLQQAGAQPLSLERFSTDE